MDDNRPFFVPLVAMAATAMIATILIVTAFVVWLSGILGSMIYTCLIVGVVLALLSTLIYFVWIREPLRRFQDKISAIYEMSQYAKLGYEWAKRSRLKELENPCPYKGESKEELVLFAKDQEKQNNHRKVIYYLMMR